jgi:acyl transferase domain-containing protein/acyl carrier protein
MSTSKHTSKTAIAVVGMAGRFPGARNLDEFWRNLREGVDSLATFSDEELRAAGVSPELLANPAYVKAGSSLERADEFDAAFFGINPREAEAMDPQHRLFLESAWEAIEDAGYDVERLPGPVGVYAGASMNTYAYANLLANPEALAAVGAYQAMIGNDKDFLATRVSYKLNLRGPGLTVQTACSTSLVAVHLACESLLTHACDMTLAGGVSLMFPQRTGYLYQDGMIFSPDGKVRPFDAKGQGIRAGEGVGVVVLKRLEDALAAGDPIRAIILGTAINNDGDNKIGYTAPSVEGQAEAIATAQSIADVDPASITYIEAHGTATPLGDPIEIAALTKAFRSRTDARQFCAIGSVKSNVGHLDAAAGVTGLIKTVLALEHREIPPSLNFEAANPQIDFDNSPFFVNATLRTWESEGAARRAGVSSFGIGGTNAHAVLEEAPSRSSEPGGRSQLLLLSARTLPALEAATGRLAAYLQAHPSANLADVAYTLQVGRRGFEHRHAFVAADVQSAQAILAAKDRRKLMSAHCDVQGRSVVFMFSGQGSQYAEMGWQLYRSERVFRETFDTCAELLKPILSVDLRQVLFADYALGEDNAFDRERLGETWLTQPALFAIEYSLTKQWEHLGVIPKAMIGHSIGEYVAACVAGVFDLETAVRIVARRGALMQRCSPGAMLSVPLDEAEIVAYLKDGSEIAAVNAPGLCVVAGSTEAVDHLEKELERVGVMPRRLRTSHAFHSAMMQSAIEPFVEFVRSCKLSAPRIPFVSNVSGRLITAEEATDPAYWGRHLRAPVRFADGLRALAHDASRLFIEVGPGETLRTLARQTLPEAAEALFLSSLPHPSKRQPEPEFLLASIGRAWLAGASIKWDGLHAGRGPLRVSLPSYPFESRRYCIEPSQPVLGRQGPLPQRVPLEEWGWLPSWQRSRPLVTVTASDKQASPKRRWLVFADASSTCAAVLDELQRRGVEVASVVAGENYSVVGSDEYRLAPDRRENYDQLLRDVLRGGEIDCVVHLWNTASPAGAAIDVDRGRRLGFYSLLYLAQALGDVARDETLPVLVASIDMQRVIGTENLRIEHSLMIGPVLVMTQDIPLVRARSVDFTAADWTAEQAKRLSSALLTEAEDASMESMVAYRGAYRWNHVMSPAPLHAAAANSVLLRERGVYLITGGTGGMGLAIAGHLASTLQARLILTSRSGLPVREEWLSILESEVGDTGLKARLRNVLNLEANGAEVLVVAADAADEGQMTLALQQAQARFGVVNGVVHAAGLPGLGILPLKQRDHVESVLRPKVEGLLLLDKLLAGTNLDFMVLCSSINSAFGWSGTTDYSSANAFMDAFAQSGVARSTSRVVSINWGTWREVGMAAELATARGDFDSDTMRVAISPEEGAEAMRRTLATPYCQLYVTPRPMPQLLDEVSLLLTHTRAADSGQVGELVQGTKPAHHQRPDLGVEYAEPRTAEEVELANIWSDLLGIRPIGINDNFFELGGHSLLATRVLARVQHAFKVRLPMRAIFDAPTIAALVEHVQTAQWALNAPTSAQLLDRQDEVREEIEL